MQFSFENYGFIHHNHLLFTGGWAPIIHFIKGTEFILLCACRALPFTHCGDTAGFTMTTFFYLVSTFLFDWWKAVDRRHNCSFTLGFSIPTSLSLPLDLHIISRNKPNTGTINACQKPPSDIWLKF